jgi:hypothetical protein
LQKKVRFSRKARTIDLAGNERYGLGVKVRDVLRMIEEDGWCWSGHEGVIASTGILLN